MELAPIQAALPVVNVDQLPLVRVPIGSLVAADSPRRSGEDLAHARMLAESEDQLPPIVVHRPTMRVIDGMHRLHAAVLRGEDEIDVRFFDGDAASSFVLAVRANVMHGLPLSLADRKAAAVRIMALYPHWSDRMVAAVTGLAAKTVASARQRLTDDKQQLDARVGRDGRSRPLDGAARREMAAQLMAANPGASLREVARQAGISPETARGVRERSIRGGGPAPGRSHEGDGVAGNGGRAVSGRTVAASPDRAAAGNGRAPDNGGRVTGGGRLGDDGGRIGGQAGRQSAGTSPAEPDGISAMQALRGDPAFRSTESGRSLLWILNSHCILRDHGKQLLENVPVHSMNRVAEAVLACARGWQDFAEHVERQRQALAKDVP